MSLAWSTIALLVMLLPGFAFLGSLAIPERFNRESAPMNTLGQLAVVVFAAFFIHALLFAAHFGCLGRSSCIRLDMVFATLELAETSAIKLGDIAANMRENAPSIVGYFALTSGIGAALGAWVGRARVTGQWPFRWLTRHSWIYQLNPDPSGRRVAMGYVVTNVEHDTRRLIYQGHLVDFGVAQDGTFTYLVLQSATRRYLTLAEEGAILGPPLGLSPGDIVDRKGVAMDTDGFLVVEGTNIKNFFFKPYRANLSKGANEAARALAEAGPASRELADSPEMLQPGITPVGPTPAFKQSAFGSYSWQRWLLPIGDWAIWATIALVGQGIAKVLFLAAGVHLAKTLLIGVYFFILAMLALTTGSRMKWWMAVITAAILAAACAGVFAVAGFLG